MINNIRFVYTRAMLRFGLYNQAIDVAKTIEIEKVKKTKRGKSFFQTKCVSWPLIWLNLMWVKFSQINGLKCI